MGWRVRIGATGMWWVFSLANITRVCGIFAATFTIVAVLFALQFLTSEGTHQLKYQSPMPQIIVQEVLWEERKDWEPSLSMTHQLALDLGGARDQTLELLFSNPRNVLTRQQCLGANSLILQRQLDSLSFSTDPRKPSQVVPNPFEILDESSIVACKEFIYASMWEKLEELFPEGIQRYSLSIGSQVNEKLTDREEAIRAFKGVKLLTEGSLLVWNDGRVAAEEVSVKGHEACNVQVKGGPDDRLNGFAVLPSTSKGSAVTFSFVYTVEVRLDSLDALDKVKESTDCMKEITIGEPPKTAQQVFLFPPWRAITIAIAVSLFLSGFGLYASHRAGQRG